MDLDAIDSRNAALLIVNMQNGLVQQKGAPGLPAAVAAMKRLIERCVKAGLPVIWTLQEDFAVATSRARKQPASHPARRRRISCLAGSWEAELIDELRPLAAANPAYVLRERGLGAFCETGLEGLLRQLGTRCLVVAGTTTNAGVGTSIRDAMLRDYDVIAVTDCICGIDDDGPKARNAKDFSSLHDSNGLLRWLEAQSAPRILGFEHLILQVADIEASRHFYLDLLGFTPRRAIPLADGRPVVPFTQGIALTAGTAGRPLQIDHMAFRVSDVRGIARRLKAAQVKFFNELHDGVYGLTIYVADPDGNKIELFQEGMKLAD